MTKAEQLKVAFKQALEDLAEQIGIRHPISANVLEHLISRNVNVLLKEVSIRTDLR